MHRRWPQRVLAILVVAWYTALVAEPVTLHPCPMHDGLLRMHAGGAMQHSGSPTAGMHGQAMRVEHRGSTSDPGSAAHRCTCIGACTAASAGGMVANGPVLACVLLTAPLDTGLPDYAYVPVAAQHVLPFAHAPPPPPRALPSAV